MYSTETRNGKTQTTSGNDRLGECDSVRKDMRDSKHNSKKTQKHASILKLNAEHLTYRSDRGPVPTSSPPYRASTHSISHIQSLNLKAKRNQIHHLTSQYNFIPVQILLLHSNPSKRSLLTILVNSHDITIGLKIDPAREPLRRIVSEQLEPLGKLRLDPLMRKRRGQQTIGSGPMAARTASKLTALLQLILHCAHHVDLILLGPFLDGAAGAFVAFHKDYAAGGGDAGVGAMAGLVVVYVRVVAVGFSWYAFLVDRSYLVQSACCKKGCEAV